MICIKLHSWCGPLWLANINITWWSLLLFTGYVVIAWCRSQRQHLFFLPLITSFHLQIWYECFSLEPAFLPAAPGYPLLSPTLFSALWYPFKFSVLIKLKNWERWRIRWNKKKRQRKNKHDTLKVIFCLFFSDLPSKHSMIIETPFSNNNILCSSDNDVRDVCVLCCISK
jgi:hypothetical protein